MSTIDDEFKNKFPEIDPVILQLLYNRGINTQRKIDEFLNPDYTKDVHDPFLFNDMEKAASIIFSAILNNKNIVVHGDYDADGVSASVILVSTIKALGAKNVSVYIPHREKEGYGLNDETVDYLIKGKADLMVTCDCGISNYQEVQRAKEAGMEVIITDHHHVPENKPPADAILHPLDKEEKYPFKYLTGGGVAFKLAQALVKRDMETKKVLAEGFDKWLLDLVAISTVADFGPLIGENRTLVKYGLVVLQKTKRIGLRELYKQAGFSPDQIDVKTIGWKIAPRINAAGRLDHANTAYQLLITEDVAEAESLAIDLNSTNVERQKTTEEITSAAKGIIGDNPREKVVIASGKDWPLGIVGLVAGRLSNYFGRPAFIMGEIDGEITGSARSNISNFHLTETLDAAEEYLARYGGHAAAAGFTLKDKKNFPKFINRLKEIADEKIKEEDLIPEIDIDGEIILDDVNWDFINDLEKFEPTGEANPSPLFAVKDLIVDRVEAIGKDEHHLRLMVKHRGAQIFKLIGFCFAQEEKVGEDWCQVLKRGDKIDAVVDVGVNEWNGNREFQFKIIDLKRATFDN